MEYDRINKAGILSPSKLRMKLMGSPNQKKKDGSNSSRTSPARIEDSDFVKNSLLSSTNEDFDHEVQSLEEASSVTICSESVPNSSQSGKENGDNSTVSVNSSAVHPLKTMDDENLDYDSNASSSSFEFHKGERAVRPLTRSFSRPTSYKWNDAEKWIVNMNKKGSHCNYPKSQNVQAQGNRIAVLNMLRVAPEAAGFDCRLQSRVMDTKRVDFCQPATQMSFDKFSFPHGGTQSNSLGTKTLPDDSSGTPSIREVSMRDMGTEMTPIPSQEPSRTATPIGATTPLRSPTSSLPSTPRRGNATASLKGLDQKSTAENAKRELSEEEQKIKTRREIVALGVQLGKMNIAAWASKDEQQTRDSDPEDLERFEYEKRAVAWEEAEKSKHDARFKGEEIKIQAWESEQKRKLEEEMRRIEAKVEEMRAHAQAKMMKKIAMARKRSNEKRMAAEARKTRQAEKTTAQAECIRQTGRIPPSEYICCGLF